MQSRKGSLSIESENMFPIIKKWLYSDHDIFIRELVSNGCDAITKLKKLDIMGEYTLPDDYKPSIQVVVDTEGKSLSFTDTGLGMTEDEVDEYINQVAFSGATDFLEKYKDKANEEQIIGHFGLGFYSAFMVADRVTIDTLSWKEGATPVRWESEGGINFEMSEGDKKEIGTTITLYLSEDSLEFANEYRVREVLTKYCSFMPVEIFLSKEGAEQEYETIDKEELREDDVVVENIVEEEKTEETRRIARKIFRAVDGSGLARVDFFIDKKTGRVLFNELNTMPGFTPISMYPMLWVQAGMTETELMDRFIELALKRDSGIRG